MKNVAIILAAGSGERFGGGVPKQFLKLGDRTLLQVCLETFQQHPGIDAIYLVAAAAQLAQIEKIASAAGISKVKTVLPGGATRQESSYQGVNAVPGDVQNVLIHDAARALVGPDTIGRVLAALETEKAAMPVLLAADTIVRVGANSQVEAFLDRSRLGLVQTPQGFKLELMRRAHERARAEGFVTASDDCSLVLRYDLAPVATVPGDAGNIKITYPGDLAIAEAILKIRDA